MTGQPLGAAREALVIALAQLSPNDNFAICKFDDKMIWYDPANGLFEAATMPALLPAHDGNIQEASYWVRQIQSEGLTNILVPIQTAVRQLQHVYNQQKVRISCIHVPFGLCRMADEL